MFVVRIDVVADLREGLIDVLHVVVGFHRQDGVGIDLPFIHSTDDIPPVQSTLAQEHGIRGIVDPAGLPVVGIELRQRQPRRHPRVQPVRNRLEIQVLLVVHLDAKIKIHRLRAVVAVANESVLGDVTAEERDVHIVELLADGESVFLIAVGPAADETLHPVDVTATPRTEVHHAAQCVVVVERGRRASRDFDAPHKPGIVDIQTGQSIGLRLNESVFVHFDLTHRKRGFDARATDRNTEIPRSVGLSQDHAGERLHRLTKRPGRLRFGFRLLRRRQRDPFRTPLHPVAHDADIGQFKLRNRFGGFSFRRLLHHRRLYRRGGRATCRRLSEFLQFMKNFL